MFRRPWKVIGIIFFLIVACAALIIVLAQDRYTSSADLRLSEDVNTSLRVELDRSWVKEGERIARTRGCFDCHGSNMAGKTFIDDPGIGLFAGPNLTRGQGGLPENYGTADFVRAVRFGLGKDLRLLQFMPSLEYSFMSDEDLGKLIVYLQSLPTVAREVPRPVAGPVAKILNYFGKMPLLFSGLTIPRDVHAPVSVKAEESADYGRYLASSCVGCHKENFAGGTIPGVPPSWPKASNLTKAGAFANWSFEDFRQTLTTGITPDGRKLDPQYMPWTATAAYKDSELKALFQYLQTLPAAH